VPSLPEDAAFCSFATIYCGSVSLPLTLKVPVTAGAPVFICPPPYRFFV
jgi:hypothetical protein